MNLDESQRQKVTAWIAGGLKLSEIQNRLGSELGLRLTYMEVRMLVDDLKLIPKDPEPPKPATPPVAAAPATPAATTPAPGAPAGLPSMAEADVPLGGGVSLMVDHLARPGTLVSGKVTFSDGQKADWYLDQNGRLGVVPAQQGYKPTAADVQQFQLALQDELAKMGF